jgi:hypothetical protein
MTSMPMVSTGLGQTSPLVASISPSPLVVAANTTVAQFQVKTNLGAAGQAKIEALAGSGFAITTLTVT